MKARGLKGFVFLVGAILCVLAITTLAQGDLQRNSITTQAQGDLEQNSITPTPSPRAYLPFVSKSYVFPSCPPLDMPNGSWEVEAKPGKGFYWPYFLYVPTNVNSTHALVVPNNTGQVSNDFCIHRQRAYEYMLMFTSWADNLGTPLIVPMFPRFYDETEGTIDPQYLGRGALEEYWQQRYPMQSRVDLQLIAMIDDVRVRLPSIAMDAKVLLWGYSASGVFVSRFTILHPNRVQAAAIGGHGWTSSPVSDWDGLDLPYPYGAGDLLDLIGASTDLAEFRSVPLYVYMGAEDTNSWALPWYIGMENDQTQYYELFKEKFGTSASSLLTSAQMIFDSLNCSATFRLYPGAGHGITHEMDEDAYNFLNGHR